jgi:acyl-coenzyme A thioesterase PaaI-like protein
LLPDEYPRHPGFTDQFTQYLDYRALRTSDRTASAWIRIRPDLVDESGALVAAVVAYMVDATAGVVCGMAAVPSWVVTCDLQFRTLALPRKGPCRADAQVRRPGRRQSLGEVVVVDQGDSDSCIAVGTVNHLVITKEDSLDVPVDMPVGVLYERATPSDKPPNQSLRDLLGLERPSRGVCTVPISGIAVNPLGFLHGSLIAQLFDEVTRDLTGHGLNDCIIRFVGPVNDVEAMASANGLAGFNGSVIQVEVSDRGGRLGAVGSAMSCPGLRPASS